MTVEHIRRKTEAHKCIASHRIQPASSSVVVTRILAAVVNQHGVWCSTRDRHSSSLRWTVMVVVRATELDCADGTGASD